MAKNIVNLIDNSIVNGTNVGCLAVFQGKTFEAVTFRVEGDRTAGTLRGQIRDKYAENTDDVLLADFVFLPMTYNVGDNKTTITPRLEASATELIPSTKFQGQGTPNIKTAWVYDLELVEGINVTLISYGFVQVIPEVTLP